MLKLFIGRPDSAIRDTSLYFDGWCDSEVIFDDFARKVIKDIDNCEVLPDGSIKSPVFGRMKPMDLSGGCLAMLILMYCDDVVIDFVNFGGNCWQTVADISKVKDITLCTSMPLNLFRNTDIKEVYVSNVDKVVYTDRELLDLWDEYGE